jgi:hypothetical protein
MRKAQIGATRRMDYSRSFLVSQAFDPLLSWQVLWDALYPSIHKRVSKPAKHIVIGNGKDVWGWVLYFLW